MMKRAVTVVVLCLLVSTGALASGELYLIDGGGLRYEIVTDGDNVSTTTCSTWWTSTTTSTYTCSTWPTISGSDSSCWWTPTWTSTLTSSCWLTGGDTSTASGQAREAGFTHSVSASTLNGDVLPQPSLNDAFDGYNLAYVRRNLIDVKYANNGTATTEPNGRQIVFPPQMFDTLQFSRKVFVPENDQFCRWLNIVTNTGAAPELVVLVIEGNLGSDGSTLLVDTSNGNTTAETDDTWLVTMQDFGGGATSSDPRLGHVLQGQNAPVAPGMVSLQNNNDSTEWQYEFMLAPGETGIIMNFVTGQGTIEAARSKAIELTKPAGPALDYMTSDEFFAVLNFDLTPYAVLRVNSLGDDVTPDGNVTLREAIIAANEGAATDLGDAPGALNLIDLGDLSGIIALTDSLPTITANVTIQGTVFDKSDGSKTAVDVTIQGGAFRIMSSRDCNLVLRGLMLTGGQAVGGNGANSNGGGGGGGALGAGGAVHVSGGSFKATRVFFNDNSATGGNGGAGNDTTSANTYGGGGGGMGANADGYPGGSGGILEGLGGVNLGEDGGMGGGGAGNQSAGGGGEGGYGGGGGGGGPEPSGGGGWGGFGGGGGGAGSHGAGLGGWGGYGGTYGGGGGASVDATDPNAGGGGGGGAGLGGAVFVDSGLVSFENCSFTNNTATCGAGGPGATDLTKTGDAGQGHGGGLFVADSLAWNSNSTFLGNTATTGNNDHNATFQTAPGVMSITLSNPVPVTGDAVTYVVVFSGSVTGVDASDFMPQISGTVTVGALSVEGADDTWFVTVPLGPSEGTIALQLLDDDTILDAALVPLGGAGAANGDFISVEAAVDNIKPNTPVVTGEPSPPEDTNVTWSWVSGGGGNGTFRWRINGAEWTTGPDVTLTQEIGLGSTLLEVQEADDSGNWSESGLWEIIIRQRMYVSFMTEIPDPDGASWETAFPSIMQAIFSAETDYVDVWVTGGWYTETVQLPGHATLYGGFMGTETDPAERNLSLFPSMIIAFPMGDAKMPPFEGGGVVVLGPETVIDGFVIGSTGIHEDDGPPFKIDEAPARGVAYIGENIPYKNEHAPHSLRNCTIAGGRAEVGAGVFLVDGESLVMENCVVSGNSSFDGAAVYCDYSGSLTAINCTFSDNVSWEGAAICAWENPARFVNCIFNDNFAFAMETESSVPRKVLEPPVFTNCLFNGDLSFLGYQVVLGDDLYTGEDLNAIPGCSGNIDADPLFDMDGEQAQSGSFTGFDMAGWNVALLWDKSASFNESLSGKFVELTFLQTSMKPDKEITEVILQAPILMGITDDEDGGGMAVVLPGWIMEDVMDDDLWPVTYNIVNYRVAPDSPAIDTGSPEGSASDIRGKARPYDLVGYGPDGTGEEWDRGAFEHDFLRVISITRTNDNPTNAQTVGFRVTFSEMLYDLAAEDLSLAYTGTIDGASIVDVYTEDWINFDVTVDTGAGDGTLRLDVLDYDTITTFDGYFLGGIGEGNGDFITGEEYLIDKTPPAFDALAAAPSPAKLGTAVTITFTASEPLAADPTVTVNGNAATIQPGKDVAYTFVYTVQEADPEGPATIVVTGSDPFGNEGTATATDILTIDKTPPAFTQIAANPAEIERAAATTITFYASEPLAANPVLNVNGNPAAYVSLETPAEGILLYTFAYVASSLEPLGPAAITIEGTDLAGNLGAVSDNLALTILEPVAPTAVISGPSILETNTGPVSFDVTYSLNATAITLGPEDVSLAGSGTTATVEAAQALSHTWTVTLSSISGDGSIGISIAAGTAANAIGQEAPAAGPSDLALVDNTAPVITLLGDNPAWVVMGDTYADAGATATDTRDGDLTAAIQTVNSVDANTVGQYTVTYTVTDAVGNSAQKVRNVNVTEYEACIQFKFPLDGSTITVDGSEDFWLVPVIEADTGETIAAVEFFLDGVSIGEAAAAPYALSYKLPSTAASYELTARAYDAQDAILCENFSSFSVVAAQDDDDSDGNGLPDNPFAIVPGTGSTWFSQAGATSTAVSTLYNCDEVPQPIELTLIDTDQVVTVTAPAALFEECEIAVVVFQMAPDLATLLGAEAAVLLPEPDAELIPGGMYYLCTILVSEDQGASFEEIDPARLAANPITLTVAGTAVPDDVVFYTHDIFADSDPLTGVRITGVAGTWDTSGVSNVQLLGVAAQLDVVKPTLFAPYVLKADDNPPDIWPWLALIAAALGISAIAGGGDGGGGGGPCFIATAAYGTPMADDIDALRGVRDEYLLGSAVGTAFVDAYYRVSPAIAGAVGAHPALAAAIRVALLPVILLSKALLLAPAAVVLLVAALAALAILRRRRASA